MTAHTCNCLECHAIERDQVIKLLVDSQQVNSSNVWQWNGSEFVTTLGELIVLIKGENK
jgi:hypothetical protein